MFTKGAKIKITRAAYEYSHMGYKDGTIIPEEVSIMTVKSARQTKNGLKVHFRNEQGSGYSIDVEHAPLFTFEAVS